MTRDYLALGLLVAFIFFGSIGVLESLSVGNFTFAALILGHMYLARLLVNLLHQSRSGGEGEE